MWICVVAAHVPCCTELLFMCPCSWLRRAGTNGRPVGGRNCWLAATAGGFGAGLDILRGAVILDRIGGLFFLRGQIWAVDITMCWWAASSSTLAHDACWTKLLDSKASRNKVLHLVPQIFQK
jgi:hypothetical protein